jgi:hypothetical protein
MTLQLVFMCLLRWCLRRGPTHGDCVVHWFSGLIRCVRLITSLERVYITPPVKLLLWSSSDHLLVIFHIQYMEHKKVWVVLFRRNPITTVCRHVGCKWKTLIKEWLLPRRCPVIWPNFIRHGYMCVAITLLVPGKIVSKSRNLGHVDGIMALPRRHLAKKKVHLASSMLDT